MRAIEYLPYFLPVLIIAWLFVLYRYKQWWNKLVLFLITVSVLFLSAAVGIKKGYEKSFQQANLKNIQQLHELGAYQQVNLALKAQQEFIERRGKLGSEGFLNSKLRAIEKELDEELKSLKKSLNKMPGGDQLQSYE